MIRQRLPTLFLLLTTFQLWSCSSWPTSQDPDWEDAPEPDRAPASVNEAEWGSLHYGMTVLEVEQMLGPAKERHFAGARQNGNQRWIYTDRTGVLAQPDRVLIFEKGRLTSVRSLRMIGE